jgi:two-component system chemotaxis response regulator CheY
MAKKVLVVDDSRIVRQQVGIALKDAGYEVIEAEDGLDGLSKIRANTDVAMVICDVNMPKMNGIEMVEAVKQGPHKDLPILMLATEGQPELIQRAEKAGAKGWIVKPFKLELLIEAIRKLAGPA